MTPSPRCPRRLERENEPGESLRAWGWEVGIALPSASDTHLGPLLTSGVSGRQESSDSFLPHALKSYLKNWTIIKKRASKGILGGVPTCHRGRTWVLPKITEQALSITTGGKTHNFFSGENGAQAPADSLGISQSCC